MAVGRARPESSFFVPIAPNKTCRTAPARETPGPRDRRCDRPSRAILHLDIDLALTCTALLLTIVDTEFGIGVAVAALDTRFFASHSTYIS